MYFILKASYKSWREVTSLGVASLFLFTKFSS